VVVLGEDQVDAGSMEISVEQQLRVRNDNGVRRRVSCCCDVDIRNGMGMGAKEIGKGLRARAVSGETGDEFAGVIQRATAIG